MVMALFDLYAEYINMNTRKTSKVQRPGTTLVKAEGKDYSVSNELSSLDGHRSTNPDLLSLTAGQEERGIVNEEGDNDQDTTASLQSSVPLRNETLLIPDTNSDFVEKWVAQTSDARYHAFEPTVSEEVEADGGSKLEALVTKKRHVRNRKVPGGEQTNNVDTCLSSETHSHYSSRMQTPQDFRSTTPSTHVSPAPQDLLTGEDWPITHAATDHAPPIEHPSMLAISSKASFTSHLQTRNQTPAWLNQNPTIRASTEIKKGPFLIANADNEPVKSQPLSYLSAAKRGALRSRGLPRGRGTATRGRTVWSGIAHFN